MEKGILESLAESRKKSAEEALKQGINKLSKSQRFALFQAEIEPRLSQAFELCYKNQIALAFLIQVEHNEEAGGVGQVLSSCHAKGDLHAEAFSIVADIMQDEAFRCFAIALWRKYKDAAPFMQMVAAMQLDPSLGEDDE